jgi:SAM-dependent methyltransferase
MSNTTFFVGDGEFLSFKSEGFEFVQTFGSLHHLPNPDQAIKDIIRILKPGGRYFGVENNKSSLRWIFDLIMKLRPLWIEEAGAEPLISERMLNDWAAGLPAEVHCETSIFLPPHVINLFGFAAARAAVDWSDRVCSCVPWLRSNGGQIVYHMRKVH